MRDTLLDTPPTTPLIRPDYSAQFQCIGPACEDTCCVGWAVYFDQASYAKYQALPAGPLRNLIDISVAPQPADQATPAHFAKVKMAPGDACPLLNEEKFCRIHTELGEEYLSVTCATYPRIVHRIDEIKETALSLSCPEAARLVLLAENLLPAGAEDKYVMTWNDPSWDSAGEEVAGSLIEPGAIRVPTALNRFFWPIREFIIWLLTHRDYALWQRLFLVGVFTRRLDAYARGELDRGFVAIRRDFGAAVDSGTLRAAMETIPADLPLQLDMVLLLAGMQLPRSHVGPRFLATVDAFTKGIGNGPQATLGSLTERYAEAHERYYLPFFAAHPRMLENLLVNTVFRTIFPFGKRAGKLEEIPEMAREFALLASQFALLKGLLIGVAGFHREAFSADHVVHTVQSASKHFEHHPGFLDEAYALLVSRQLDNVRGLTMLLRN